MSNDHKQLPEPDRLFQCFETIDDIPLELRGELDRRTISFRELTELEVGNIIKLNRPAGENIDLYAGQVLIGTGEILVMDGVMTLRVADILGGPAPSTSDEPAAVRSADEGEA